MTKRKKKSGMLEKLATAGTFVGAGLSTLGATAIGLTGITHFGASKVTGAGNATTYFTPQAWYSSESNFGLEAYKNFIGADFAVGYLVGATVMFLGYSIFKKAINTLRNL